MSINSYSQMDCQPLSTFSHEPRQEVANGEDPVTGRAVKQHNSSFIDYLKDIGTRILNWLQQLFSPKSIEEYHDIKQLSSGGDSILNTNKISESVTKEASGEVAENNQQSDAMQEGAQSAEAVQMAEDVLELGDSIDSDPKKQAKQFGDFLFRPLFQNENENENKKDRHIFTDLNKLANQAFKEIDKPVDFMKECANILQALKTKKIYSDADMNFLEAMVSLMLYSVQNKKTIDYLLVSGSSNGDKGKEYILKPIKDEISKKNISKPLMMQELSTYLEISVLRKLAAVSDGITSSVNKESYSKSKIKHPVAELGKVIPKMTADLATYGDILVAASAEMPEEKEPSRKEYKSLGSINPQQMIKGLGERFRALSETIDAKDSSFSMIQQVSEQAKKTESVGEEMYMQMRASRLSSIFSPDI